MALPPLLALKATGTAQGGLQKALTGDIYSRKWVEVRGKGAKAKIIEHEAHLNPVGLGLGAVALGGAALLGLGALWMAQLKLKPTLVKTYKTVIDVPEVPAYNEHVPIAEVGHWADNTVSVGEPIRTWVPGVWLRGVYKPGEWMTYRKVETVPGQHWVVDVEQGYDIIPHAAIPAVTHQEETGVKKRFSIEQRRGFSAGDVLEEMTDAVGLGAPITAAKVIPKLFMDPLKVFRR